MDTWLVVGLGNPGARYAGNRHNVGAHVVAELAARGGVALSAHKGGLRAARVHLPGPGGTPAVLAVPTSYMNVSGPPVREIATFYKVPAERVLVVHDELDIDFGRVRLKRGGGEGGHNGLRSVTASLGTKDYLRVRVGIGRPPGRLDPADFVLRDFTAAEQPEIAVTVALAADAVELLISDGLLAAQQRFHPLPGGP
ncbi:aminoacyl-tRNA hydrolase [Nostocoides sp.]|uniref:aminoacyl-tRNA hydrolase n=1 Tax=Nostocoides sp. TaxID=1917966 RepID=UPI002D091C77|nr:aminoacyl-tRNA hydrolase [Tetrasphaera sp.]